MVPCGRGPRFGPALGGHEGRLGLYGGDVRDDLDSAAVKALNRAGPYPNPPKGLLDANGNAQIRWDFVLKT